MSQTDKIERKVVAVIATNYCQHTYYYHPETQPGELPIGNSTSTDYPMIGWKSKRKGIVAYDIYGNVIPPRDEYPIFPVFANLTEMCLHFSKKDNSLID